MYLQVFCLRFSMNRAIPESDAGQGGSPTGASACATLQAGHLAFQIETKGIQQQIFQQQIFFCTEIPLDVKTIGWLKGKVVQNVDCGSVV